LEYETDFVRGFGRKIVNIIEPENDAGNGERLILFGSTFKQDIDKLTIEQAILKKQKLLITVSSYFKAGPWRSVASPPRTEEFSAALDAFRSRSSGAFILFSRIDGIDLPQDTCRVMLIDGAPSGASLLDQYLFSQLKLSNMYSTKMASRITQFLGRINRGRSDYGSFILFGRDINNWINTERNVALLPPLIRKQVILGQSLQNDVAKKGPVELAALMDQVISRDSGWLNFYRDTVDGLEVSDKALARVKEREAQLAESVLAECKFMTRLWEGDVEGARTALLDILDMTAIADAKLAGWYSMWLGMTYESENDLETAVAHYKKARLRLSSWLNVPFRSKTDIQIKEDGAKSTMQREILAINRHGPQALGDFVAKLRAQSNVLSNSEKSSRQHEEALRVYGELLGFSASRPDNESGSGPDVIWKDDETKDCIAFELKTKKSDPAEYSKDEIGQAHNHMQWLKDECSEYTVGGLLIVGPSGICRKEASPSVDLFLVEISTLTSRLKKLSARIDDNRGNTAMERWGELSEISDLFEW
jgi:tetratricopeptide (TPR) repeat protein